MDSNPYDIMPYKSYPFQETRPQHLYAMALLYGLDAPDYSTAKVLELGCASGGNIIPLATQFPQSHFVGIDYSTIQIDQGQAHVDNLGLQNIELIDRSILDIDGSFGKFDYIICHGVYSWVPNDIRQKILRICQQNLSSNGVATISYNTQPGWNSVASIRQIMRQHTSAFDDPFEKCAQVREMIHFLSRATPDKNSSWAKLLETEISVPGFVEDSYIFHEYLEDHNEPFYFTEFMANAVPYKLQHLADLDCFIYSPYLLNNEARDVLLAIDDKVQAEQYMDYITNRRFRKSLLCHSEHVISKTITTKFMDQFKFFRTLKFDKVTPEAALRSDESVAFNNSKIKIASREPAIKMAFELLTQPLDPIDWTEIVATVTKRLPELSEQAIHESLSRIQFDQLIALNILDLTLKEDPINLQVPPKPKASQYARYQAPTTNVITNLDHQLIALDRLGCLLMPLVDGTRNIDQLVTDFSDVIEQSEHKQFEYFVDNEIQLLDKADVLNNIEALTNNYLQSMAEQAFLQQ